MCSDHRNLKNHPVASSVLEDDRAQSQSSTILDYFFFSPSVLFLFVCLDVLIYRLVVTVHFVDPEPRSAGFCSQQPVPCAAAPRDAIPELFLVGPQGATGPQASEALSAD